MCVVARSWMLRVLAGAAVVLLSAGGVAGQSAEVKVAGDAIEIYPPVEYASATVRLTGGGQVIERQYQPSKTIVFKLVDNAGKALPDGSYSYEVALVPALNQRAQEQARYQQDRKQRFQQLRQEQNQLDQTWEAGGKVDDRGAAQARTALAAEARPEDTNGASDGGRQLASDGALDAIGSPEDRQR